MDWFVTTNNKTKVVARKKGYPTCCKTFIKKSDGIIWTRKGESEMERSLFENTDKAKTILFSIVLDKHMIYSEKVFPSNHIAQARLCNSK